MRPKLVRQFEHELLGSLVQDIQTLAPCTKNTRKHVLSTRMHTFSAPPAFLDVDYKLDFDFLDNTTFDSLDPDDQSIMEAFSKKQGRNSRSLNSYPPPVTNYRKLSCDSLQYCDSPNVSSFDYYEYPQMFSPTEELFNHLDRISEWTQDQNGSRTVQEAFQKETDQKKDAIFYSIFKHSMNLITDRFGNYIFQKIFEIGLPTHKQLLFQSFFGSFSTLSIHAYGCRVIQKALQYIKDNPQYQQKFISQINENPLILIENQNGNHVIQKCFQIFPHSRITKIVQIITNNLNFLAYHAFGCRVIQKYLQCYIDEQKCQQVLAILLEQSISLSQCQFGNYVMQHIVVKCKQERKRVFQIFLLHVYELSTNKYASNVMEKAIQASQSTFCNQLSQWFANNQKNLITLSKHQYGNYVVQSMMNKLSKDKRQYFKQVLKENVQQLSKSQHGKHVLLQLDNSKSR